MSDKDRERREKSRQQQDLLNQIVRAVSLIVRLPAQALQYAGQSIQILAAPMQQLATTAIAASSAAAPGAAVAINISLRLLRSMINAAIGANAAVTPLANLIMLAAVTAVAPSFILRVASELGINNADDAAKLAAGASAADIERAMIAAREAISAYQSGQRDASAIADGVLATLQNSSQSPSEAHTEGFAEKAPTPSLDPVFVSWDRISAPENETATVVGTFRDSRGNLKVIEIPVSAKDHEATATHPIKAVFRDVDGREITEKLDLAIVDVNEAPTLSAVSTTYDGQHLLLTLSAYDPDAGDVVVITDGGTWHYTIAELAAGVPSFSAIATDAGGLTSAPMLIEPPKILKAAVESGEVAPTPPIILGYSLSSLPENQGGTLTVTAYDTVDGVITRDIPIAPQDYEALASKVITYPVEITNSAGLSAHGTAAVTVTNVDDDNRAFILKDYDPGEENHASTRIGGLFGSYATDHFQDQGFGIGGTYYRITYDNLGYTPVIEVSGDAGRLQDVGPSGLTWYAEDQINTVSHRNTTFTFNEPGFGAEATINGVGGFTFVTPNGSDFVRLSELVIIQITEPDPNGDAVSFSIVNQERLSENGLDVSLSGNVISMSVQPWADAIPNANWDIYVSMSDGHGGFVTNVLLHIDP